MLEANHIIWELAKWFEECMGKLKSVSEEKEVIEIYLSILQTYFSPNIPENL